jgi:hypothetical protein
MMRNSSSWHALDTYGFPLERVKYTRKYEWICVMWFTYVYINSFGYPVNIQGDRPKLQNIKIKAKCNIDGANACKIVMNQMTVIQSNSEKPIPARMSYNCLNIYYNNSSNNNNLQGMKPVENILAYMRITRCIRVVVSY